MNVFRIDQKVKIKRLEIDKEYGGLLYEYPMSTYAGEEFNIKQITKENGLIYYRLKGNSFAYTYEMLEAAEDFDTFTLEEVINKIKEGEKYESINHKDNIRLIRITKTNGEINIEHCHKTYCNPGDRRIMVIDCNMFFTKVESKEIYGMVSVEFEPYGDTFKYILDEQYVISLKNRVVVCDINGKEKYGVIKDYDIVGLTKEEREKYKICKLLQTI